MSDAPSLSFGDQGEESKSSPIAIPGAEEHSFTMQDLNIATRMSTVEKSLYDLGRTVSAMDLHRVAFNQRL